MTTLATLRTQISEDYLKDPNNRIFTYPMVDRALNKGYEQVQSDLNYGNEEQVDDYTFSTTGGTMEYALPDDFIRVKLVRYNGTPLVLATKYDIKRMNATFVQGTPYWYYTYGDYLGVYPIPSGTGTIDMEYLKLAPTLTTSVDTLTPTTFDDAIMLYASYKLLLGVEKYDKAAVLKKEYQEQINKLRVSYVYNDDNIRFTYQKRSNRTGRADMIYPYNY